ncbi:MAG: hypothetical protein HQK83_03665 [Fibrobacteria bacterium]|nr:hypothetical protein [Fibrobacteria bacterium]
MKIKHNWILILSISLQIPLWAGLPTGKMLALPLAWETLVNNKKEPNEKRLTWEEINEVGINTVSANWLPGTNIYTKWEWVNEAHEHGFWVYSGPPLHMGMDTALLAMASLASLGVDFAEADEPFKWETCSNWPHTISFTEADYKNLRKAARVIQPDFPFLVTDVNCNQNVENWTSLDGLLNEFYYDDWYATYRPQMEQYADRHPNQFVGAWIYFLEWDDYYTTRTTDAQFETWLNAVYNGKLRNTLLFIWSARESNKDAGSNGNSWSTRAPIIKRNTGGGPPEPTWQNFTQSTDLSGTPDFSVQVRSAEYGLDTSTVRCYYALRRNDRADTKWIRHDNITISNQGGEKDWISINAERVPFASTGTGDQYTGLRIRFKIKDKYNKNHFRNARTIKKDFAVTIKEQGWSSFSGKEPVTSLNPDFSILAANSGGLDQASLKCEYSADGGKTWHTHPSQFSGPVDSIGRQKVTVNTVPFSEDKPGINRIRFSINSTGGTAVKSPEYPVILALAPELTNMKLTRNGDKMEFSVSVKDVDGLRVGSQISSPREETVALYRFDGNANNTVDRDYNGTLKNGAAVTGQASWKTTGGQEDAVCFSTDGQYTDMGAIDLGASHELSISGWVKAENNQAFVAVSQPTELGAMKIRITEAGELVFEHWDAEEREAHNLKSSEGLASYNQWHHFIFSFDGTSGSLYLDGNRVAYNENFSFASNGLRPLFLAMPAGQPLFFKGCMDDLHVQSHGLTEAEAAAEYYSGLYRFSTDGGKNWSGWKKMSADVADGAKTEGTMSVKDLVLPSTADSVNRIEVTVRDIYGNTALRQFILLSNDAVQLNETKQPALAPRFSLDPISGKGVINFSLLTSENVELVLYNLEGKIIKTVISNFYPAGQHTLSWNGIGRNNRSLPLGQYIVRFQAGRQVIMRKLLKLQ